MIALNPAGPIRRQPQGAYPFMFAVLTTARKQVTRIVVLFSLLWLAACDEIPMGSGSASGGPRIDPNAPVPVALLVPRGGGNSGDDLLAQALENAARLAIADLDGVRIDLRVYGTAGRADMAQQAALQAVSDGAQIILGPVYAESANAVAVAVAPRGINVLAFSNNSSIAGGNLWVLGPTFENTANRLASYARRQGKQRIVLLHSDDVQGQMGATAIQSAVARSGGTLAGTVSHEFSQSGVVAAVPRVVETYRANNADAVFMTANSAGALPLFAQMLPEAGLPPSAAQYIGLTRWDIPAATTELAGLQGGWFALPDPTMAARFSARYQSTYGRAPHPIAGLSYDGIAAIGALAKAGRANALTGAALTQGAGFQGVGGIFRLRPDGTNERGLAVAQIRNREVVVIDPAPQSFGGSGS